MKRRLKSSAPPGGYKHRCAGEHGFKGGESRVRGYVAELKKVFLPRVFSPREAKVDHDSMVYFDRNRCSAPITLKDSAFRLEIYCRGERGAQGADSPL